MRSLKLAPTTLFVEITTECNLRCRQCHMWRTRRDQRALTIREKARVIEEFGNLTPSGGVVFTGGEPYKEAAELFELCHVARNRGLRTLTNTNGTYFDGSTLTGTITSGPDTVVFSLDSHLERTHDFIRGVRGTYRDVLGAIAHVLESRMAGRDGRPIVYISAILCELTLYAARDLVEFARRLGVDGITFQMLERTFMHSGAVDRFFETYSFRDTAKAKATMASLANEYADDSFVLLSAQDFHWMGVYIDHPLVLPHPVCGSHERNVWVDMYGETQLCAYMRAVTAGRSLGNVRERSIIEMLNSELSRGARAIMESCLRACGMLNCHRKM